MDNIPSRTSIAPTALNSGAIDMRALASRRPTPATSSVPTMDLLLSVVTPVSPLGPPLAIHFERPRMSPSLKSGAAILLGSAIALLAGLAAASMHRELRHAPAVSLPASAGAPTAPTDGEPAGELVKVPSHAQLAEPAARLAPEPAARATRRPRPTDTSAVTPAMTSPTPTVSESAPRASEHREPSLEELMHRVSGAPSDPASSSTPTPAMTSPAMTSPTLAASTPSRDDVRDAMARVTPAVEACASGERGLATVTVSFAGETGRVRSAVVGGDFAGTPAGSCIARAVREAELPPFSRSSFTVRYPFSI